MLFIAFSFSNVGCYTSLYMSDGFLRMDDFLSLSAVFFINIMYQTAIPTNHNKNNVPTEIDLFSLVAILRSLSSSVSSNKSSELDENDGR